MEGRRPHMSTMHDEKRIIMAPYDLAFIAEIKSTLKFRKWDERKKDV